MFDVCTAGDTTHIDTLLKFLPHTRQHGCIDILPLGQLGHVAMVGRIPGLVFRRVLLLCTKCALHSNHRLHSRDIPTHKAPSSPERPFSHYIHSHRLTAEMWTTMKNKLLGIYILSCSFYLYTYCKYLSYGFPIINFCNPGVHYKTPYIYIYIYIYIYTSLVRSQMVRLKFFIDIILPIEL